MQRPLSGLVRHSSTAEKRQRRPQTSLGFSRKSEIPTAGRGLAGFDVREYFRRHGSSAGLQVGVNGRPSGDAALQSYVEECRVEVLLRELDQETKEEEERGRERFEETRCSAPREREFSAGQRAPLCWDALVRETEARKVHWAPFHIP